MRNSKIVFVLASVVLSFATSASAGPRNQTQRMKTQEKAYLFILSEIEKESKWLSDFDNGKLRAFVYPGALEGARGYMGRVEPIGLKKHQNNYRALIDLKHAYDQGMISDRTDSRKPSRAISGTEPPSLTPIKATSGSAIQ